MLSVRHLLIRRSVHQPFSMAPRLTRASLRAAQASEAPIEAKSEVSRTLQLSSPPLTPAPVKLRKPVSGEAATGRETGSNSPETAVAAPTGKTVKRKRAKNPELDRDINELPHNLGNLRTPPKDDVKQEGVEISEDGSPNSKRPKNAQASPPGNVAKAPQKTAKRTTNPKVKVERLLKDHSVKAAAEKLSTKLSATSPLTQKGSHDGERKLRLKANPYGLTPGETPFPDWPHPTPEECHEVVRLLSAVHGEVKAPATLPTPSTTVSGCGEVPSILDALIRTLLSAATTGTNSSRAFQGLVDKFGLLEEGIGKGSVNWDNVRRAPYDDVFQAIKSGGLAKVKSKNIQLILNAVYEENQARKAALLDSMKPENATSGPAGAKRETKDEKDREIIKADEGVLSLDHLHALTSDEALSTLIKYPGIGPKTASCVMLFCMQRPSFAVDTHVFRLVKWLGWMPPDEKGVTRNSAFSHCDVRIPDEYKYALHQLFIKHGKTCARCRAATGESAEGWEQGCPIDHLIVQRTGKRKGPASKPKAMKTANGKVKGKGKRASRGDEVDESDEASESELSALSENDDVQLEPRKKPSRAAAAKSTGAKKGRATKKRSQAKAKSSRQVSNESDDSDSDGMESDSDFSGEDHEDEYVDSD